MSSVQALQASAGGPRSVEPITRTRSSTEGRGAFDRALATQGESLDSESPEGSLGSGEVTTTDADAAESPAQETDEDAPREREPERDARDDADVDDTSIDNESAPLDIETIDLEASQVEDPATVFVAPQRAQPATTTVEAPPPGSSEPTQAQKRRIEAYREPAPIPTPRPQVDGADAEGVLPRELRGADRGERTEPAEPRRLAESGSRATTQDAGVHAGDQTADRTDDGGDAPPDRQRDDRPGAQELPRPERAAPVERAESARVSVATVDPVVPSTASSTQAPSVEVSVQAPTLATSSARVESASLASALQPQRAPDQQPPSPVVDHAARGISTVLAQKGGSLTMKLNPPALGELRIEMNLSQQTVDVRLEATTPAARELLTLGLPALRESLQSKGLSVERLSVQASTHAAASTPNSNTSGASLADQGGANAERSDGGAQERADDGSDDRPRDGSGGAAGNGRGHAERAEVSSRSFSMKLDALV